MSHLVLVVDDDGSTRQLLTEGLDRARFELLWAEDPSTARALLDRHAVDVVLLAAHLGRQGGLELGGLELGQRTLPVLWLGAESDTALALHSGAAELVSEPLDAARVMQALERALRQAAQQRELLELRQKVSELQRGLGRSSSSGELLGESPAMRGVQELLERASASEANVFISGEPGTGKELVARTIAGRSARASGPFLAINCAALPEALLEAELFGQAAGASPARSGLLERAKGGTLFLDEVGALSPGVQTQLLRALQERLIRPLGSSEELPVDVRLICASNQDLETAIEERRFRADLYYRINVIAISLPPLRARGTDVLLLANHFLRRASESAQRPARELSADAERCLMSYSWPGNVRELQSHIEHAAVLARGPRLEKADLPEKLREQRHSDELIERTPELPSLEEIERRYILRVFEAVHGNKSQAALVLGLDRKTLYRRLERYGMLRTDSSRSEAARLNGARADAARAESLRARVSNHVELAPGK